MKNIIKQIYRKALGFECAFYLILTWVFLCTTHYVSLMEFRIISVSSGFIISFLALILLSNALKMKDAVRITLRSWFAAFGIAFATASFSGMECFYQENQFHATWQNNAVFIVLLTFVTIILFNACRKEME